MVGTRSMSRNRDWSSAITRLGCTVVRFAVGLLDYVEPADVVGSAYAETAPGATPA